tara:strand:+ start:154 stop:387 length:234 start_codon:yes stop_codon:yes gene_type:complete
MIAVLESHSVEKSGMYLNQFVRRVLKIDDFKVFKTVLFANLSNVIQVPPLFTKILKRINNYVLFVPYPLLIKSDRKH